jgi:hypothetical protein
MKDTRWLTSRFIRADKHIVSRCGVGIKRKPVRPRQLRLRREGDTVTIRATRPMNVEGLRSRLPLVEGKKGTVRLPL